MEIYPGELFIVFGGGCFGTHHVRHIEKGRKRGRISPDARIIVVDRNTWPPARALPEIAENRCVSFVQSDWLDYMKKCWDALSPEAEAVPAPVAPHLAFEWLTWSLRDKLGEDAITVEPVTHEFGGLPYEYLDPVGCRYISAANWVCPTNCRAPHICPMTRDVRTWELEDRVNKYAASQSELFAAAVVFKPKFRVPGIDKLYIKEYTEARDHLLALSQEPEATGKSVVVGTVSSCHGAVSQLRLNSPQRSSS
ncbi:MAG: hypothetical protein IVW55_14000 [Chloroflexi bacterium]|nr:hypothetical protein [Chloroflexota bacterium]